MVGPHPVFRTGSWFWYENSRSNFGSDLDLVRFHIVKFGIRSGQKRSDQNLDHGPGLQSMLRMVRFKIFDFRYDTKLWYELWNRKSFTDYTFLADPSFYSPMKVLLSAHKECYLLKTIVSNTKDGQPMSRVSATWLQIHFWQNMTPLPNPLSIIWPLINLDVLNFSNFQWCWVYFVYSIHLVHYSLSVLSGK